MTTSKAKPAYGVQMSDEIEKTMHRCRAPMRAAIRKRLDEIAARAGHGAREAKASPRREPALRFYVYEGYRITYRLDFEGRRVVVLDLELLPVD